MFAGIRAAVTGMILVTGCRRFRRTVKSKLEIAVVTVFFVLAVMKVSPALLILAAVPFGWCYVWWQTRRLAQAEEMPADGKNASETSSSGAAPETREDGGTGK